MARPFRTLGAEVKLRKMNLKTALKQARCDRPLLLAGLSCCFAWHAASVESGGVREAGGVARVPWRHPPREKPVEALWSQRGSVACPRLRVDAESDRERIPAGRRWISAKTARVRHPSRCRGSGRRARDHDWRHADAAMRTDAAGSGVLSEAGAPAVPVRAAANVQSVITNNLRWQIHGLILKRAVEPQRLGFCSPFHGFIQRPTCFFQTASHTNDTYQRWR